VVGVQLLESAYHLSPHTPTRMQEVCSHLDEVHSYGVAGQFDAGIFEVCEPCSCAEKSSRHLLTFVAGKRVGKMISLRSARERV